MRARPLALVLSLLFVSLAHAQTPPPPAISTILPATGGIGTSVTITGSNFGGTQGQSVVTFNGISARVTTWSDTSIVAKAPRGLSPGSATIIVAVSQTASNGVQYTVTQPLFVTPNQATLTVGDTRSMQLIDENGALINNSTWTFYDPSIAEIIPPQNPGDPTLLQADAAGTTDFVASFGDRTGIATITVLPAGAAFPVGTVQWSVLPLGSFGISKTVQSLRIDDNTPDLYIEDDGAYGGNGSIRALTSNGQQKWIWPSTNQDKFPALVAADDQGGLLYFANQDTPNQFGSYCYFGRVDENGNESWQYQETNCSEDYAIAPDGTIFLVEDAFQNSATTVVTALDSSTGQVKFTVPLPAASQVTTGADATEGLDPNRPS
jgi:IPT/TIG domain